MNGMIGADPDALERLAGDFTRGAGSLETTALRIRVVVLANPWAGARATRFRSEWDHDHGPQLKRTAAFLRGAAKQLRLQAQEQRRASSAGGSGSSAGVPGGGGRGRRGDGLPLEKLLDALQVLGISAGLTASLGRWNMHQNDPAGYRALFAYLDRSPMLGGLINKGRVPDLMRYNKSPVLQLLARDGITSTLKPAAGVLGKVAKGADLVGAAAGAWENAGKMVESARGDSLAARITAGTYALDAASDAAMASKAGFLYGLAGKAVALPVREAMKSDFSAEGQSLVLNEIARNPGVVGEELVKATGQVTQTVVSWFAPIPAALK